jgi:hypothetical protein
MRREENRLRLGQKVTFTTVLVKPQNKNCIDIDTAVELELDEVNIEKLVAKNLDEPKQGIVVGIRNVGVKSTLSVVEKDPWHSREDNDFHLVCRHTEMVKVYLVASNLSGFHKVRVDDVEEDKL